jgi:hypothetical protein
MGAASDASLSALRAYRSRFSSSSAPRAAQALAWTPCHAVRTVEWFEHATEILPSPWDFCPWWEQNGRALGAMTSATADQLEPPRDLALPARADNEKVAGVVRQAETVEGLVSLQASAGVKRLGEQLRTTVGLVHRILAQTRARVLRGDTHHPDKVLSLFEPHTEAIRKGKAIKPTEFGNLLKIQETEAQFITDYAACATRVPDGTLWEPSLMQHEAIFGRPPRLAAADVGLASAANIEIALPHQVRAIVLTRQRRERRPRAVRAALR